MRVLFDHQVFSWQSLGGISRYAVEIIKGMNTLGHQALLPEHFYSENVYLKTVPGIHTSSISPFNFKGKKWLQERLGQRSSLKAIAVQKPDIFHPTYFDDYFLEMVGRSKTPFVLTIHDMIHEKFGHGRQGFFSLDAQVVKNKRLLAQAADAVIVVSENTRQDLLHYIPGLDPTKIHSIHHGNSLQPPPSGHKLPFDIPERFLLFVGQRRGYKNFNWMVAELADLLHRETGLYLLCAGGGSFDTTETEMIGALGLQDKIKRVHVPHDEDLAELYARAQCFLFPTTYEGFGIPVLEAFACGCPVVLNAVSSLPEVGGEAVLYFDAGQKGSLVAAVESLLQDSTLRESLVKKGYTRLPQFSWQNSVNAHLKVYQRLLDHV